MLSGRELNIKLSPRKVLSDRPLDGQKVSEMMKHDLSRLSDRIQISMLSANASGQSGRERGWRERTSTAAREIPLIIDCTASSRVALNSFPRFFDCSPRRENFLHNLTAKHSVKHSSPHRSERSPSRAVPGTPPVPRRRLQQFQNTLFLAKTNLRRTQTDRRRIRINLGTQFRAQGKLQSASSKR